MNKEEMERLWNEMHNSKTVEGKKPKIKWEKKEKSEKQPKPSLLHQEISLSFTPKKLVKPIGFILILLCVFALGRFSVDATDSISGLFSFSAEEIEEIEEVIAETEPSETEVEDSTLTEPEPEPEPEPVVVEEEEEEEEERIVTTYSRVSFAISEVTFDWKETWGKIEKVYFVIKNEEKGSIEPDYITMRVEGYPDRGSLKEIPLPTSVKLVKSGTKASTYATVPDGFSYRESATGSLNTVRLTFVLYDPYDTEIATFSRDFDLMS